MRLSLLASKLFLGVPVGMLAGLLLGLPLALPAAAEPAAIAAAPSTENMESARLDARERRSVIGPPEEFCRWKNIVVLAAIIHRPPAWAIVCSDNTVRACSKRCGWCEKTICGRSLSVAFPHGIARKCYCRLHVPFRKVAESADSLKTMREIGFCCTALAVDRDGKVEGSFRHVSAKDEKRFTGEYAK